MSLATLGTGFFLPPKVISNSFFEGKLLHKVDKEGESLYEADGVTPATVPCSVDWIVQKTGIHERRFVEPYEGVIADMATDATKMAFEGTDLDANKLEGIVVATVSNDQRFPAVASEVAKRLGIEKMSYCFDISVACAGFVTALGLVKGYAMTEAIRPYEASGMHAVIGVERLSKFIDYRKLRTDYVLFGDGAGAVILGPSADATRDIYAVDSKAYTDKKSVRLITHDQFGLMNMGESGRKVFEMVVRHVPKMYHKLMDKTGWYKKDVALILHQANDRITDAVATKLELSDEQVMRTIRDVGNTSAASIPITLAKALRDGRLQKGQKIIQIGFGSGMVFSGAAAIL